MSELKSKTSWEFATQFPQFEATAMLRSGASMLREYRKWTLQNENYKFLFQYHIMQTAN